MEKEYHKRRELSMADLGLTVEELAGQPLELVAREGAKVILGVALEEEVYDFLQRRRYEHGGSHNGYRNGHRRRKLTSGAGEIEVEMPRVSDTQETFHSRLVEVWQRRSRLLEEIIPLLYVEGLSTRDFKRALGPLWGDSGLSRSSISRANQSLKESFDSWRRRDLSLEDIIYLFLDGIYLGVRTNSRKKEAILIAHGVDRKGQRVLLHLSLGVSEGTDSWKAVFEDLVERGLKAPQLFITDGNPGLVKAINDVWPQVPRQRCVIHRLRNVLARVPKSKQDEIRKALNPIFYAACLEDAKSEAQSFLSRYARDLPTACEVLVKGLEECLTFYRFPESNWKFIRTSNVLERTFREVKRRTNVIGRFPTEISALMMVFGILEEERLKWNRVRIKAEDILWIEEAARKLDQDPIRLDFRDTAAIA
jgi:putative transposase